MKISTSPAIFFLIDSFYKGYFFSALSISRDFFYNRLTFIILIIKIKIVILRSKYKLKNKVIVLIC